MRELRLETPGDGVATTFGYDVADRVTVVTGPDTTVDAAGERTSYSYDAAGRPTRVTTPKGTRSAAVDDFATTYVYDSLDRVLRTERREVSGAAAMEVRLREAVERIGQVVPAIAWAGTLRAQR